jgi:purine-nucleoside phosphorylase
MPLSSVPGHAGNLVTGQKAGKRIIAMQGRAHLYEGNSPDEVAFGVRLMAVLGAETLIVTNAAGGISPALEEGDLMAITDQLNLTGASSLVGENDAQRGPRFLDMTAAFDPALIETASSVANGLGFELKRGVYAGLLGPAYETPAEVRMLKTLGADAVGMSTVLEVLAARHMGLRVLGVSCVSNLAAGISKGPLSHAEVQATAGRVRSRSLGCFEASRDGRSHERLRPVLWVHGGGGRPNEERRGIHGLQRRERELRRHDLRGACGIGGCGRGGRT